MFNTKKPRVLTNCAYCGAGFLVSISQVNYKNNYPHRFCNAECYRFYRNTQTSKLFVEYVCIVCGKTFKKYGVYRNVKRKTCSKKCSGELIRRRPVHKTPKSAYIVKNLLRSYEREEMRKARKNVNG